MGTGQRAPSCCVHVWVYRHPCCEHIHVYVPTCTPGCVLGLAPAAQGWCRTLAVKPLAAHGPAGRPASHWPGVPAAGAVLPGHEVGGSAWAWRDEIIPWGSGDTCAGQGHRRSDVTRDFSSQWKLGTHFTASAARCSLSGQPQPPPGSPCPYSYLCAQSLCSVHSLFSCVSHFQQGFTPGLLCLCAVTRGRHRVPHKMGRRDRPGDGCQH